MTKMNRRDYLMGIGASAGALAVNPNLKAFAQRQRDPCRDLEPAIGTSELPGKTERPKEWQNRWDRPFPTENPMEVVKLIFYGQTGFCGRTVTVNSQQKIHCDVGFHSVGDSRHHHRLSLVAYTHTGSPNSCSTVFTTDPERGPHLNVRRLEMQVDAPAEPFMTNGVYFYQPTYSRPVERRGDLEDPKDFRWIIDFESEYLYLKHIQPNPPNPPRRSLPKKNGVYRPTLTVPNGLFYVLHKTGTTFRVQTRKGEYVSELGCVPDLLGANIYVRPNTEVAVIVNGAPRGTPPSFSVRAPCEIYFANHCYQDNHYTHPCQAQPFNMEDKGKRSDFFLHYEAFERGNHLEYEMVIQDHMDPPGYEDTNLVCLGEESESRPLLGGRGGISLFHKDSKMRTMSDEAPCSAAGYGGGEGLPRNS